MAEEHQVQPILFEEELPKHFPAGEIDLIRKSLKQTLFPMELTGSLVPAGSREDSKALDEIRRRAGKSAKQLPAKTVRAMPEYQQLVADMLGVSPAGENDGIDIPDNIDELISIAHDRNIVLDYRSSVLDVLDQIVANHAEEVLDPLSDEICSDCIDYLEDELAHGDLGKYSAHFEYDPRGWDRRRLVHDPLDSVEVVRNLVDQDELCGYIIGYDHVGEFYDYECDFYSQTVHRALVGSDMFSCARDLICAIDPDASDDCWDRTLDTVSDWGCLNNYGIGVNQERQLELIAKNPHYTHLFEVEQQMEGAILDRIPEAPIDAYPLARSMERRFVLHVGPTNSGKTHDAIEALGKAPSGVYLGPLRLLAFEQYEKLNEMGCLCSLRTGEEERKVEGAAHYASTIEMMDFGKRYEVAVIDEAQMMADPDRGDRWTAAILGVAAHEVHVCMAPDALDLVKQLVELCGDGYEVVEHERFCPLEPLKQGFAFPGDVREGDAVIVFSRRAVHAVAAELAHRKKNPMKVSMIYGALPYDVRHAEAEKFASGKSQVVVATDAIGMGMNLPIKRIVFLEVSKYDGTQRRFLKSTEVKQIAGRAGRYGIHESGEFVAALENKKIRLLFGRKDDVLKTAPLGFPSALIGVEGRLSAVMGKWAAMEVSEPFEKTDSGREIALAKVLEAMVSAGIAGAEDEDGLGSDASAFAVKELVYKFATIPFKDNLEELAAIWEAMFRCEMAGGFYPVEKMVGTGLANDLQSLEDEYARMDLLYQYCRVFGYADFLDTLMERRDAISAKMIELLGKGGVFDAKKCRECGKSLPWNWPYPMCDACHDRLYPPRWSRYDYWDDGDDDDYMYYR